LIASPGHDAAQHAVGRRQVAPGAVGQPVDVFQELRALRQQLRAGMGGFVVRPFQAGIANVKGQKSHRVHHPGPAMVAISSAAMATPQPPAATLAR